ncbi:hypothetical protein MF406_13225 [Georgenia sp. TF02-10]|uniref:hypothetical protein n=1 Tax=Georgenia sp. TF02-10 TaxID=2917725 RepID=UPI001FA7877F|nr:hypothetical protein [Georgenia sp. TF02-10]UNX53922.1 hypothetical protein MF406_13225 [Georgenia sp. TF02-10]
MADGTAAVETLRAAVGVADPEAPHPFGYESVASFLDAFVEPFLQVLEPPA